MPDAGSDRSMSNTAAPAQAAWYATEAPTMPAPTTTTSVTGEPRTRDSVPGAEGSCPGRRSAYGTPALTAQPDYRSSGEDTASRDDLFVPPDEAARAMRAFGTVSAAGEDEAEVEIAFPLCLRRK